MNEIFLAIRLLASFIYNIGGYQYIEDMSYTSPCINTFLEAYHSILVRVSGDDILKRISHRLIIPIVTRSIMGEVMHPLWVKEFIDDLLEKSSLDKL